MHNYNYNSHSFYCLLENRKLADLCLEVMIYCVRWSIIVAQPIYLNGYSAFQNSYTFDLIYVPNVLIVV